MLQRLSRVPNPMCSSTKRSSLGQEASEIPYF